MVKPTKNSDKKYFIKSYLVILFFTIWYIRNIKYEEAATVISIVIIEIAWFEYISDQKPFIDQSLSVKKK